MNVNARGNIEAAEPVAKRRRTWSEVVCPHCSDRLTKTTFYRHKKLYYDSQTGQWQHTSATHTPGSDARDASSESDGHSAEETDCDLLTFDHEETATTLTTTPSMILRRIIISEFYLVAFSFSTRDA